MAPSDRTYRFEWSWDLPAEPSALWPLVSDTDRFNRDTGLPEVDDAREEDEELEEARRRLRFAVAGVTLRWEEQPFEWVRPRRFGVVRRYDRGPLREMRVQAELDPLPGGGTHLRYEVTASPSGLLGALTIPIQIGLLSRLAFGRVFREYGERAAAGETPEAPPRSSLVDAAADRRRAGGMVGDLVQRGVDASVARPLAALVVTGDDASLDRIRPYVLADLWDVPRRDLLEACLHATREGYLQLRWDVLCPLCRGAKETAESLRELRRRGVHCDTCLIDFSGDFVENVEITFRPTPAVRDVREKHFCVAGPQVTPHVVVQQLLGPGEIREVRPVLDPGRYRLRSHGSADGVDLRVIEGGAREEPVDATSGPEGWEVDRPEIPTRPLLRIRNDADLERLLVLERTEWADHAATAADVTRLATFRDLFSDDVLRKGDFAEVGTLSVLFTDLLGSTRLYRTEGDATAFGRVMDHFEVLEGAVADEGGTVVKTIGDAVMAVFPDPAGALRAALAAHLRLRDVPPAGAHRLVLKAGIHAGPCLTVTLNDVLDYFGTTVNVAARLGSLSGGDEIVVSDAVWSDPVVREVVTRRGLVAVEERPDLRGLETEETTVHRIAVTPARRTPEEAS